ncbi:MAG: hypothetical protein ACHQ1E_12230 [Ktedonobacterales bacterium]
MAPDVFSDVSSPQSACPACGASATREASYCVACGQPIRRLASVRIVEADGSAPSAQPDEQPDPMNTMALATGATSGEPSLTLGERLTTLASVAWRQPAVRSAVTTGASAVALSLVWRVAGAALRGGRARRMLLAQAEGESLAPMVNELLHGATPGKRLRRRGRRGEIIEEMVYVRRIFRR